MRMDLMAFSEMVGKSMDFKDLSLMEGEFIGIK